MTRSSSPSGVHLPRSGNRPTSERFRTLDRYRAEREWRRYEGNALRDLFRELRRRFLVRNFVARGWVIDAGCGPGRFTAFDRSEGVRWAAFDVSSEMLRTARRFGRGHGGSGEVDWIRADARFPPFRTDAASTVIALGNLIGFLEGSGRSALVELARLVEPHGRLLLEIAPGPGTYSVYLHRLPDGVLARRLRGSADYVVERAVREGFVPAPFRRSRPSSFVRYSLDELRAIVEPLGFELLEALSVAPALGRSAERLERLRNDDAVWNRLVSVEEVLGREPGTWPNAAAVLAAFERHPNADRPVEGTIKGG